METVLTSDVIFAVSVEGLPVILSYEDIGNDELNERIAEYAGNLEMVAYWSNLDFNDLAPGIYEAKVEIIIDEKDGITEFNLNTVGMREYDLCREGKVIKL